MNQWVVALVSGVWERDIEMIWGPFAARQQAYDARRQLKAMGGEWMERSKHSEPKWVVTKIFTFEGALND